VTTAFDPWTPRTHKGRRNSTRSASDAPTSLLGTLLLTDRRRQQVADRVAPGVTEVVLTFTVCSTGAEQGHLARRHCQRTGTRPPHP